MKVKKDGRKRWKIVIISFIILVLLIGGFFGFKAYKNFRENKDMTIFQQGFTYGYTGAVLQIINVSDTCQPFPVYVGNQTRNLISVECLNQAIQSNS
jgi:hypothetical protein